jgi:hypothetical protein
MVFHLTLLLYRLKEKLFLNMNARSANTCATIAGWYLGIGGVIPIPITIRLVFARAAPS